MQTSEPTARLTIPEFVTWYAVGDRVTVICRRTDKRLRLNATASHLWLRLAEAATGPELVAHLLAAYELSESEARRDVAAFLDALTERRIVYPLPPDPESRNR